jgi:hypothetical protein
MALPTLFELCVPREDVQRGSIAEADFAADLAQVLRGDAPADYRDPVRFFANTHPTRGLKTLLQAVCERLSASSQQISPIFRLDTQYGGGKTHALIALVHAAQGMPGVGNVAEFMSPDLVPRGTVRIAAFDGENADPFNGRAMGHGVLAYTPWGEIAYALAGSAGYERVRRSDEAGVAPGAETVRELFGGQPTLILLDELSIYLRRFRKKTQSLEAAGEQLAAFLTTLFKAVEGTPNATVVYTLAVGKKDEGTTGNRYQASDAYSRENLLIANFMEEAEKISARKATLLNPTEENETVAILRRRFFQSINDDGAKTVIDAYRALWTQYQEVLPRFNTDERVKLLTQGYPLHPELMATLTEKTATLPTFQRVRGMLRLLAKMISRLWAQQPAATYAIHSHHLDLGYMPLHNEVLTRLQQGEYAPAVKADVAGIEQQGLAPELDAQFYAGLPTYTTYAARTLLLHSLAHNDDLKGLSREQLHYACLAPDLKLEFLDQALDKFITESGYLDDRPTAPLRFQIAPNLTNLLRREEQKVDPGEVRTQLHDRISELFKGRTFNAVPFASDGYDLPDDDGNSKPYLAIIGYDAAELAADSVIVPPLVERLFNFKSGGGEWRKKKNNVVFLLVDATRKAEMHQQMIRHLALKTLQYYEGLAAHQQATVKELYERSKSAAVSAIQQAYRHVLYPAKHHLDGAAVELAHSAIELPSAGAQPGDGEKQVVRQLQAAKKLRVAGDEPDSPTYIRDLTPLKKGKITTAELREEFRRNVALPMLVGDEVFLRGLRRGIEQGEYVYQCGELFWGQTDPPAAIKIDEQSWIFTAAYARDNDIYPRPPSNQSDYAPPPIAPVPSSIKENSPSDLPPVMPPPLLPLQAEGLLKETLLRLWEQARGRKLARLIMVRLEVFELEGGLKLFGLVSATPNATVQVVLDGGYETSDGSLLELKFEGTAKDFRVVKDFLEPQRKAAKKACGTLKLTVTFQPGLPLAGDEPEKFTDKLTRLGAGTLQIRATAEGEA